MEARKRTPKETVFFPEYLETFKELSEQTGSSHKLTKPSWSSRMAAALRKTIIVFYNITCIFRSPFDPFSGFWLKDHPVKIYLSSVYGEHYEFEEQSIKKMFLFAPTLIWAISLSYKDGHCSSPELEQPWLSSRFKIFIRVVISTHSVHTCSYIRLTFAKNHLYRTAQFYTVAYHLSSKNDFRTSFELPFFLYYLL